MSRPGLNSPDRPAFLRWLAKPKPWRGRDWRNVVMLAVVVVTPAAIFGVLLGLGVLGSAIDESLLPVTNSCQYITWEPCTYDHGTSGLLWAGIQVAFAFVLAAGIGIAVRLFFQWVWPKRVDDERVQEDTA